MNVVITDEVEADLERIGGNYLIFYRVTEEDMAILHVLHGAQDYEAILFPEI